MARFSLIDFIDWKTLPKNCVVGKSTKHRTGVAELFESHANELMSAVSDWQEPPFGTHHVDYMKRLWNCFEYHWKRIAEAGELTFAEALKRVEEGRLSYGLVPTNVLSDLALAYAMEQKDNRAASLFQSDYLPLVIRTAQRVGGEGAVDAVGNFAYELIVPREKAPPRIATFTGKTPLQFWLRSVVSKFCYSRMRNPHPRQLIEGVDENKSSPSDSNECEELLQPVFEQSIGNLKRDERLLLQMLILDNVSQKDLAAAWGLHSGTLTRRRKQAERAIWQNVSRSIQQSRQATRMSECLESVTAGENSTLRRALADALSDAVRISSETQDRGDET